MPVWHKATRKWRKEGRLVILGVVQEQHRDRPRLFAQWQKIEWPILQDPINLFETKAVPRFIAIDEHGIIRSRRPRLNTFASSFLDRTFKNDAAEPKSPINKKHVRKALTDQVFAKPTAKAWRTLGDHFLLWEPAHIKETIATYAKAVNLDKKDGNARFRLGVALRKRWESSQRHPTDFQLAVQSWEEALGIDPNQYIWRRRIQQYGPRLTKPYPFYDWVSRANREIAKRGEKPVKLKVALTESEQASPSRSFSTIDKQAKSPDPQAQINLDNGLIQTRVTSVPTKPRAGRTVRIHVTMSPNKKRKAHWNNLSKPLRLWIDPPKGWQVSRQLVSSAQPKTPESAETRLLDFELKIPGNARGQQTIQAYALYFVCEDVNGVCLFLRQNISIKLNLAK